MAATATTNDGPTTPEPDPSAHLTAELLAERLAALPAPAADEGIVELVVVRPETGARATPARCRLTVERGVEGDRWSSAERRVEGTQVSMMRADIARVIANGQPLSMFGDNLLVALDLSFENLPAATQLRIGTALCVATEKPHTGCAKFASRFGDPARAATQAARVRGMYLRVVEDGEVAAGDRVVVLSRPPA